MYGYDCVNEYKIYICTSKLLNFFINDELYEGEWFVQVFDAVKVFKMRKFVTMS